LKLVKFSRILQGTGPAVGAGQDDFLSTPTAANGYDPDPTTADLARTPAAGNIIEYQIRYKNISEAGGTNSVILNVSNLVITENGTGLPGSNGNWAADNNADTKIDTSHVSGSAVNLDETDTPIAGTDATVTYFNNIPPASGTQQTGNVPATNVTQYVNTFNVQIAPGVERRFNFQRQVEVSP
jgi:hypothetical protein